MYFQGARKFSLQYSQASASILWAQRPRPPEFPSGLLAASQCFSGPGEVGGSLLSPQICHRCCCCCFIGIVSLKNHKFFTCIFGFGAFLDKNWRFRQYWASTCFFMLIPWINMLSTWVYKSWTGGYWTFITNHSLLKLGEAIGLSRPGS